MGEVSELEKAAGAPDFWNNREKAEQTLTRIKRLKNRYEPWQKIYSEFDDLKELYAMALEAGDESLDAEISELLQNLSRDFERQHTIEMLSDEADGLSCFITIHSGAGGTESNDWVRMLYRMYSRYAEKKDFAVEIVDEQPDEGGFKAVSIEVKGDYAYGFLKNETGVHRLVRISPFDSNARRHTTFASVYVSPVLDDTITLDIRPDDLRIDTYRASGAGGQKVNKTSSAVRITHLPTNIVVQCQNERSQHRNKEIAMQMLKSRLYDFYKKERDAEREANAAEKKDIGWGSQVRSYVFQPYMMVKDARTKAETANVQAVMDGGLDIFIDAALHQQWGQTGDEEF
jgi:peptide chain release factor 2